MQKAQSSITENLSKFSFEEKKAWLIHSAMELGGSFALFRKAGQTESVLMVDVNGSAIFPDKPIEELNEGFLFCPFEEQPDKKMWVNADLLVKETEDQVRISPIVQSDKNLEAYFETSKNSKKPVFYENTRPNGHPKGASSRLDFIQLVEKGVAEIKAGSLEKIVPSRVQPITLPDTFSPEQMFNDLCKAYKNAFISLVSIPGAGTWIGASPEILIQIKGGRYFETVSLAGTQACGKDTIPQQVAWTQKEIEEQALVSRYVINCFKKIRLREFEEAGPKTIRAGNLLHLKTTYKVDMEAVNFPQLGSVMLDLLHPTSAVCGMPLEAARDFIHTYEKYPRSYFSGYLGPVNFEDETQVYVNLRCMEFRNSEALLYAGAGVTEDSDPQKEWEETETKLHTLLTIIHHQL